MEALPVIRAAWSHLAAQGLSEHDALLNLQRAIEPQQRRVHFLLLLTLKRLPRQLVELSDHLETLLLQDFADCGWACQFSVFVRTLQPLMSELDDEPETVF